MAVRDTLASLTVDISTLRPYPDNPRNGDTELIGDSLKAHGQYRPIVVWRTDSDTGEVMNTVLAGNHTYAAAMELGWTARIVLVDNRANDQAKYDEGQLAKVLASLAQTPMGLIGTGYDQREMNRLLKRISPSTEPDVEFSPALWEETNYVVLYFDNAIDWQAALETLGLKPVKCWDSHPGYERTGLGRVIPGTPVIRKLAER
jgi:hypothetical protein